MVPWPENVEMDYPYQIRYFDCVVNVNSDNIRYQRNIVYAYLNSNMFLLQCTGIEAM